MNLSLPNDLLNSFSETLEIDEQAFIESHQQAPVISVRLNPSKPSMAFENAEGVPWCSEGRYLTDRPNFTHDPLLHAGCYYVQEASSMFLSYALQQVVDFNKQLVALDACAAPGGKSTLLASLLNDESLLIANEVISSRASILTENLNKWGKMNTWVTQNDPKQFTSLSALFDIILVDAPCSGSGLFRKKPEFANDWNMDMVKLCAERQKRILHDLVPSLQQNGILVYMTCSFCESENEEMVDFILEKCHLTSVPLQIPAAWGIVETQSKNEQGYGYRFFPHLLKGEGFFLACFVKGEMNSSTGIIEKPVTEKKYPSIALLEKYVNIENKISIQHNDYVMMIHSAHEKYLQLFSSQLKLIKKGILAGKMIRDELLPDHELAMYGDIKPDIPFVELSLDDSIRYLKKESIHIENKTKGWLLVQYQNRNLGWIKNLGNRVNNYYPSNYRILR
ncbi:MAG: RNA methyltransferase [Bacteroidetes bacterium]|nr:RNA methyltransferase [Bacteroidota bacterium]